MNVKSALTLSLGIIALGLSTPVFANPTSTTTSIPQNVKPVSRSTRPDSIKITPGIFCKVCAQWGQGQPGQLFGPCLRYEYKPCTTPAVIR